MGFIGINDEATMKGIRDCCTAHVFIKDLRLGSNNKEGKKSGKSPRILRQPKNLKYLIFLESRALLTFYRLYNHHENECIIAVELSNFQKEIDKGL